MSIENKERGKKGGGRQKGVERKLAPFPIHANSSNTMYSLSVGAGGSGRLPDPFIRHLMVAQGKRSRGTQEQKWGKVMEGKKRRTKTKRCALPE